MQLIRFMDDTEDIDNSIIKEKGILIGAHTSDLHFGVTGLEPATEYKILKEQFVDKLKPLPLDYVAINGDTLDHKSMSSSDMILYAIKLVDNIVEEVCKPKGIPLIILAGTFNHDANQLKLFYHYMDREDVDVRIIESIQFTYIKNKSGYPAKVLCIPELYGLDESVYQNYLFENGMYDMCLMHGTIQGSVPKDEVGQGRLFHIRDFMNCMGPTIAGHVHSGGCFHKHFYYCGSPISWRFDDDYRKGFLLSLHNLDTHQYYIHKELIHSFRYETMNLDFMLNSDPKDIIDYISKLKENEGIDYIKIVFEEEVSPATKHALNEYFRNKRDKVDFRFTLDDSIRQQKINSSSADNDSFKYIFDKSLNEYEKLSRYINEAEKSIIITADELSKLLEEDI